MSNTPSDKPAHSRLEHFPINIFALIMGLGGFGIATHKLEMILGWTDTLSMAAVIFASGMFMFLLAIYLLKLIFYPAAVKAEWNHPIKLSFFPAISISMLILSICFLAINKQLSLWVWIGGATIQLITALAVIRYWIKAAHFKEQHLNPAWFIPAVGNVLVPVAGMAHGFVEISWFFFSFGLLFWIILQAIIFNRLIFHTPLPERLAADPVHSDCATSGRVFILYDPHQRDEHRSVCAFLVLCGRFVFPTADHQVQPAGKAPVRAAMVGLLIPNGRADPSDVQVL